MNIEIDYKDFWADRGLTNAVKQANDWIADVTPRAIILNVETLFFHDDGQERGVRVWYKTES